MLKQTNNNICPASLPFDITARKRCAWPFSIWPWPLARAIAYACLSILPLSPLLQPAEALDWRQSTGFRSAALPVPKSGKAGFTLLGEAKTGISFTNHLSDQAAAENQIRLGGSGVALGDIDGDGWCDIYLCRLEGPNVLYRNLGNWRFEDITAKAGVACPDQFSTGAVFADVDGDGDLDLLITGLGVGTRLFLNDGKGHFSEAANSGLVRKFGATSMALADIDGDGDLDLYVANYRTTTVRSTGLQVLNVGGKRMLRPQDRDQYEFTPEGLLLEFGEIDILYLNDGKGNFSPAPWTDGRFLDEDGKPLAAGPKDWGLSVMFRDLDGDGWPDIYVCNDFWSPDRVWLNDGKGHFRAAPRLALRHTSTFSMNMDVADINRDGYDDLMVLDMLSRDHGRRMRQRAMLGQAFNNIGKIDDRPQVDRNNFHLNRGDGTYVEIAQLSGLQASEWSWCVVFLDVDLDGYEDLLVNAGHLYDSQDSDTEARIDAMGPQPMSKISNRILMYPRLNVPKAAFHNRGDLTFEEVGAQWNFNDVGVAHGMALADLDNDGDLDVVVNNLNAPVGIYRNDSPAPRVAVRLKGKAPNTRGIGAKIKVSGGPVPQSQEIICGGRYLSGDEAERVFAAGNVTNRMQIEVTWRSGRRSLVPAEPNRIYEIDEASSIEIQNPKSKIQNPASLFKDVSNLIPHVHQEVPFDDFARQSLLSRRLSQLGPGVAWFDYDGDGLDDLAIGSGRGGELAFFRNQGNAGFALLPIGSLLGRAVDDQTSILGWSAGPGACTLQITKPARQTSLPFRNMRSGPAESRPRKDYRPRNPLAPSPWRTSMATAIWTFSWAAESSPAAIRSQPPPGSIARKRASLNSPPIGPSWAWSAAPSSATSMATVIPNSSSPANGVP